MTALPSHPRRHDEVLETSQAADAATTTLVATGLVKRFGQTEALRGVDVAVARGEILAVMGPSGSGKSTLLHCLAGILTPDGGEVRLDGQRIDDLGEAERSRLRRTVFGFVFQFGQLVPELPAVENAALPLMLDGQPRSTALSAAADWLDRLGLGGLEGRRPGELSGGQAQRVAIARALAMHPRIVFADEPTGSLDSLAGEQVMNHLTEAARSEGVAVVLVTHEPRVAAFADREVIVRDGRIRGAGAPTDP
jgi:putative ABC transport system ATP-binding protein